MASAEYRLKTAAKLIGVAFRLEREDTFTLSRERESNVTVEEAVALETLRQAEFREQRGVEKGHYPRYPVGAQVQHV